MPECRVQDTWLEITLDTSEPYPFIRNVDIEATSLYFESIKGFARHEDGLLNNRVNWCLLFNSFLFTALAVLTTEFPALNVITLKILPLVGERSLYATAALSIAFTGFTLTVWSALGVIAATIALGQLGKSWENNKSRFAHSELYPDLLGAGSGPANWLGIAYPRLLIGTLLAVWLVVFFAVLASPL